MGLSNIVNGHLHALLRTNEEIAQVRLKVCSKCALRKDTFMGYVCNSKLWTNSQTGDISTIKKDGYVQGCGCLLNAKARDVKSLCPAGKW